MGGTVQADILQKQDGSPTDLTKQEASKVRVNLNGTGTIALRDSFNVSSVGDDGLGHYTINKTNAMAAANYCMTSGTRALSDSNNVQGTVNCGTLTYLVGSFDISTAHANSGTAAFIDSANINVLVTGDLA